jgi:hypothetical protein
MAIDRIVLGLMFAIGGVAGLQGAAYAQDNRGTMEQQIACTPDVWRLCGDQIPDVNRIVSCLRQNTPQLSPPCRAVFDSNNTVAQAPLPRGRGVPPPRPYARPLVPPSPYDRTPVPPRSYEDDE